MTSLNERERAAVYFGLTERAWNGPGDPLCDLWDALDLSDMKAKLVPGPDGKFDLDQLSGELTPYKLSTAAAALLIHVLGRPGQPLALALVSSRALRRL